MFREVFCRDSPFFKSPPPQTGKMVRHTKAYKFLINANKGQTARLGQQSLIFFNIWF